MLFIIITLSIVALVIWFKMDKDAKAVLAKSAAIRTKDLVGTLNDELQNVANITSTKTIEKADKEAEALLFILSNQGSNTRVKARTKRESSASKLAEAKANAKNITELLKDLTPVDAE